MPSGNCIFYFSLQFLPLSLHMPKPNVKNLSFQKKKKANMSFTDQL